jgi:predicted permease
MGRGSFPGPVTEWLLGLFLAAARREEMIGDLIEEARLRVLPRRGRFQARLWLLFEVARAVCDLVSFRDIWTGAKGGSPLSQDVRFAFRTLRRRPLFTLAATSALALGIGATTTVFSFGEATLLRRLPYPEAGRILSVWTEVLNSQGDWVRRGISVPEYLDVRELEASLGPVAISNTATQTLRGMGNPEDLNRGGASEHLPEVLGIQPILGRWFTPEEVGPDFVPVAVLGHSFWVERFGADTTVVGRMIDLEERPYRIIGVVPSTFRVRHGLFRSDVRSLLRPRASGEYPLWAPFAHNYGNDQVFSQRRGGNWEMLIRMRPGLTRERAEAMITPAVVGDLPPDQFRVRTTYRTEQEVAGLPSQLLLLGIPAALLLLIACGNVATLQMGEGIAREREIKTRVALGAGKLRIARQLVTENILLGVCGSAAGAAVAYLSIRALVAYAPAGSVIGGLHLNLTVLAFASAAGVLAGLAFGLAPLAMFLRPSQSGMVSRARGGMTGAARQALGGVLAFEVAITVILLVTGGLFTRTFLELFALDTGYDVENLIAIPTAIDRWPYPERGPINHGIIQQMAGLPGVDDATGSGAVPLVSRLSREGIRVEGRPTESGESLPPATWDAVMPGYLRSMGIPLLEGREFTEADGPGSQPVAIVSESTARRLWPDGSALGRRVGRQRDSVWATVVGVAGDVLHGSLGDATSSPVYVPYLENPNVRGIRLVFTVRTSLNPAVIVPRLEQIARSAEPDILIREAQLLSTVVSNSATDQRYRALMLILFATAAVTLASVGIFGVAASTAARRTRELAIRMALGAEPGKLGWFVVRGSLLCTGVGIAVGLFGAWAASRLISAFLFGVESSDPLTFLGSVTLVLCVAGIASYWPSRRAARMQPAVVLSEE